MTFTPDHNIGVCGQGSQRVLEAVLQRAKTGSRDDGHRLGLVVEGGAMRGIYSAAFLLGLHAMGLSSLFDDIYATSAGAVNAAHFLSGIGQRKIDTYYRFLVNRRFMNVWRFWKMLDVDYLVDQVLTHDRPIETEAILNSPTRFWVSVIDYVTASPVLLNAQTCGHPPLEVIRAASAVPFFYNRLIRLGDIRGFDGGICNPFPIKDAIAHGCTRILVLLVEPQDAVFPENPLWQRMLFNVCFSVGDRQLNRHFDKFPSTLNHLRDLATGRVDHGEKDLCIATLCPEKCSVGAGTQDTEIIRAELIRVVRATLRLFQHSDQILDDWIASGSV